MYKEFTASLAVIIFLILTIPYYHSIIQGKTKPHVFSWLIWGLLQSVAAVVQYVNHAGPGVWVTVWLAINCFVIATFAIFRGEKNITHSDLFFLMLALAIIPLWVLTDNSLMAAIFIAAIDALGYCSTIRKSLSNPYQEPAALWAGGILGNFLSILAIETYSLPSMLCPAEAALMNISLVTLLLLRRRGMPTIPG